jgi:hypothetical protein
MVILQYFEITLICVVFVCGLAFLPIFIIGQRDRNSRKKDRIVKDKVKNDNDAVKKLLKELEVLKNEKKLRSNKDSKQNINIGLFLTSIGLAFFLGGLSINKAYISLAFYLLGIGMGISGITLYLVGSTQDYIFETYPQLKSDYDKFHGFLLPFSRDFIKQWVLFKKSWSIRLLIITDLLCYFLLIISLINFIILIIMK